MKLVRQIQRTFEKVLDNVLHKWFVVKVCKLQEMKYNDRFTLVRPARLGTTCMEFASGYLRGAASLISMFFFF